MSGADGYQKYVDTSAKAATGAGIEHHDPAVRAKQASMGVPLSGNTAQGSGDASVGILVLIVVGIVLLFAAPFFLPTFIVGGIVFEELGLHTFFAVTFTAIAFAANAWGLFRLFKWLPEKVTAIVGALNFVLVTFLMVSIDWRYYRWRVNLENVDLVWLSAGCAFAAILGFYLFRWISRLLKN